MTKQKQLLVLIGLLVLWGALVWLEVGDEGPETTSAPSPSIPQSGSPSSRATARPDPMVATLTPMENPKGHVTLTKPRNIFAPLRWTAPRTESAVRAKTADPRREPAQRPLRSGQAAAQPSAPSPGELAAQRARQQLMRYRFLGYLTRRGESRAFLTNGQAIYIVRQGEVVDGGIRVRKIDPTTVILSMTVGETGDQIEASIPLVADRSS